MVVSVKKVGGRFLVKGGLQVVIEGFVFDCYVIIEFFSCEVVEIWYQFDEYQVILLIVLCSLNCIVVIVEGYE